MGKKLTQLLLVQIATREIFKRNHLIINEPCRIMKDFLPGFLVHVLLGIDSVSKSDGTLDKMSFEERFAAYSLEKGFEF